MTVGKTIALTICTFVSRVMSLLFKTLPRFVIAFLSRSNHLISCCSHHAQRFITQEEEIYHYFHHFLFYLPCSNGARCHDLSFFFFFLIFNFKLALSLSFFTFIKRLFSSSLLSATGVISSTYLRLLVFLLPVLTPAYNSSSLEFLMMQHIG